MLSQRRLKRASRDAIFFAEDVEGHITSREFWGTHDAIEVLGQKGWKVSEPGSTYVTSVYVAKVGSRGAVIRVPKEWLASIGAKKGRKIKARVRGKRLVMELA